MRQHAWLPICQFWCREGIDPHVVGAKLSDDLELVLWSTLFDVLECAPQDTLYIIKRLSTNYMWVHAFPAPNLAYGLVGMHSAQVLQHVYSQ